jgi:hypothetical protein
LLKNSRYDSEEERVLERLERLGHQRQQAFQAKQDFALLEEYRRKYKKNHRNAALFHNTGPLSSYDHPSSGANDNAWTLRAVLREHQNAWNEFEQVYIQCKNSHSKASAMTVLEYDDVPWIPDTLSKSQYLEYSSEDEQYKHAKDPMKKAYAAVCLRWHPDAFQNKFQAYFSNTDEWSKVIVKVKETFQDFQEAWENVVVH